MKALSLRQPWASLVAAGSKRYETRSWATAYRGLVAIHASARWQAADRALCEIGFWAECLHIPRGRWQELPLGAVLAICTLADCVPVENLRPGPVEPECFFGNYAAGRYAWRLEDVRLLPQPVSARGSLGLWAWAGR